MPGPGDAAPAPDIDAYSEATAAAPTPQGLRYSVEANVGDFTNKAVHWAVTPSAGSLDTSGQPEMGDMKPFDQISPDEANATYGVPGYLRFNETTTRDDAAWRAAQAHHERFSDQVLATTTPTPLRDLGASLGGALLDPIGLPLMLGTDGLGTAVVETGVKALGLKAAVETGEAVSRLGRVANAAGTFGRTVGEGAINQIPFVAANAIVTNGTHGDYTLGDGLRDIAAGAILHTGVHYFGTGLKALTGLRGGEPAMPGAPTFDETGVPPPEAYEQRAFHPDPAPASGVPDEVAALPPTSRLGAWAKATDDMAGDRPVDVGQYVTRELEPPSLSRLDEAISEPTIPSWRYDVFDVAVTPRGTEVPVRYGLVEARDLVTSHDNDLSPNPDYPQELQPRQRERAGAIANNLRLQSELNPKLLMTDTAAGGGAPIVSSDGVVESGNGRTIAVRRSYDQLAKGEAGGAAATRYRAELQARGFDTTGMDQPILVRARTRPMTGAQRGALAREMNADVTERMGAVEQAKADAAKIPAGAFDVINTNDGPTTNRAFARDFIAKVAPDQANTFANADGSLSPEGARRIKAAVLYHAFGDERLVAQLYEGEKTTNRKLADALAEVAPRWAQLRDAAAKGSMPAELDVTSHLNEAVDLVRQGADKNMNVRVLFDQLHDEPDMFSGKILDPNVEAFLRLFFKNEAMTQLENPATIASSLRDYARQAMAVTPGPDLFGDTAGESTARQILDKLADQYGVALHGIQPGDAAPVRAPGKPDAPAAERHEPVDHVVDLRPAAERGNGPGGEGLPKEDQPGAGDPAHVGSADRTIKGATVTFHSPAQAAIYDLGVKLKKLGTKAAPDADLEAEIDAVRRSAGRVVHMDKYQPAGMASHDLSIANKAEAKWVRQFEDRGRTPSRELMMRYARDYARGVTEDPAMAAADVFVPHLVEREAKQRGTITVHEPREGGPPPPAAAPADTPDIEPTDQQKLERGPGSPWHWEDFNRTHQLGLKEPQMVKRYKALYGVDPAVDGELHPGAYAQYEAHRAAERAAGAGDQADPLADARAANTFEGQHRSAGRLVGMTQEPGTPPEKLFSNFANLEKDQTPENRAKFHKGMFDRANKALTLKPTEARVTWQGDTYAVDTNKEGHVRVRRLEGETTLAAAQLQRGMIDSIATNPDGAAKGDGAKLLRFIAAHEIGNIHEVPDRSPGFVKIQRELVAEAADATKADAPAGAAADTTKTDAPPKPTRGDAMIAADPELRALQADTERLAAQHGIETPSADNEDPNTVADAIRAAAICLSEEAG